MDFDIAAAPHGHGRRIEERDRAGLQRGVTESGRRKEASQRQRAAARRDDGRSPGVSSRARPPSRGFPELGPPGRQGGGGGRECAVQG